MKNCGKQKPEALRVQDILSFYKETPLLSGVPESALLEAAEQTKVRMFPKGSVVFHVNEPAKQLFFIYAGFVTEFVAYGSSVDIIVKTRRRHDYIGEMGILAGKPYLNSAVAMEPLTLLSVSKEVFLDLLKRHYCVSEHIILQLIDRLTNSARKMVSTMYLDAPARLAFTLVSLSGDMDGRHHAISITQSDLAASSGIARQTVAKILGEWRKAGWVVTERGKMSIRDIDALLEVITYYELK